MGVTAVTPETGIIQGDEEERKDVEKKKCEPELPVTLRAGDIERLQSAVNGSLKRLPLRYRFG